jgi:putative membrane protein
MAAWALSAVLLGTIGFLYLGPKLIVVAGLSPSTLPKVNACLNAACALVLVFAWRAILRKNIRLHKRLMLSAVALSALFLASYVVQHGSFPSVNYGGTMGWLYYPVLISHIVLAAAIVPMVLITLVRALSNRFDKHRKIARWTLPLWLYVSITGVVVYLMCAPYY